MAPRKLSSSRSSRYEENDDNGGFIDSPVPCNHLLYNQECRFGFLDALFGIVSMLTFVVDIGTDLIVTVKYIYDEEYIWAGLTLALICISSIVMQIFSTKWYINDDDMTWWKWILHLLQLGPLYRYLSVMKTGIKARKTVDVVDFERLYHQQNDVCMLRLFEAFMESAPQLVLQLYIMLTTNEDHIWTGVSAAISLISLSWSIAAYSKAHRQVREDKKSISWPALILHTVWRIGMITSRVVALVFFASVTKTYTFAVLGAHWLGMTIWIHTQKTDFCESWCMERLFNCVLGMVYCFCFFNLKEGLSRYRVLAFYNIMLLENSALIVAWYLVRPNDNIMEWYEYTGLIAVWAGFVLGTVCMIIYYQCFHPAGPIKICQLVEEGSPSSQCHHDEDPDHEFVLPHHPSIEIFEDSEFLKSRDSSLAFPLPRTPSMECVEKGSHRVDVVHIGKEGTDFQVRNKCMVSYSHSELASVHSLQLGLSGFTDDLLDHFDTAKLAFYDQNNHSQIKSVSMAVDSSYASNSSQVQSQSAKNSPRVAAKLHLNRNAYSASNSPQITRKSKPTELSIDSSKTGDTTESLEAMPNISLLGPPPKSTDADEIKKIYDAILGVCKATRPISARRLFKSNDSIDGPSQNSHGKTDCSQSKRDSVSAEKSVSSEVRKQRDSYSIKHDTRVGECRKTETGRYECKRANGAVTKDGCQIVDRERFLTKSKLAALKDQQSSKSLATLAQIRQALHKPIQTGNDKTKRKGLSVNNIQQQTANQGSSMEQTANQLTSTEQTTNQGTSNDISQGYLEDEIKLEALMKKDKENYYHLVSNSLVTLNSTGRSELSLLEQSKPNMDKLPSAFQSANLISEDKKATNDDSSNELKTTNQIKDTNPGVGTIANQVKDRGMGPNTAVNASSGLVFDLRNTGSKKDLEEEKVERQVVGKLKPQKSSTPLLNHIGSNLNKKAMKCDTVSSKERFVQGKGKITSTAERKENVKKAVSVGDIRKDSTRKSRPLTDSSNLSHNDTVTGMKEKIIATTQVRHYMIADNGGNGEPDPKHSLMKTENRSLIQLHGKINIADKVVIFEQKK